MKLKYIYLFIGVFIISVACSDYNQVLKGDDYSRKFELANELYDGGKYTRSIGLYEQVYQRFPKTSQGEISYLRMGKGFYLAKDYYMAGYYLGSYYSKFPYSEKAEEALFLSAMCSVNTSPIPSLDQNDTEVAINELQQFIDRYPNSSLVDSCNTIMDQMQFKLERKDYDACKVYSKTLNYRAAVTSSEVFLEQYPGSIFAEEVAYISVFNSELLAINSIPDKKMERIDETLERYSNFVAQYSTSKYLKDLQNLPTRMKKMKEELIAVELAKKK